MKPFRLFAQTDEGKNNTGIKMKKQNIQISDLYRLKLVSDPQISPDGSQVVFVVETMHKGDKKYYT
ncbi:MAG TPA: hypothetical protein EYN81_06095, partial [Candidatus Marinimicrobia bacterium]|nr:hypothetical protein [Candidatus Neomarinimicrobiota bacterium]